MDYWLLVEQFWRSEWGLGWWWSACLEEMFLWKEWQNSRRTVQKTQAFPLILEYWCVFISPSTLKLFETPAIVILLLFFLLQLPTHIQCSDWPAVASQWLFVDSFNDGPVNLHSPDGSLCLTTVPNPKASEDDVFESIINSKTLQH